MLGGFINNWLISGITNIQSGPNMQTGVSASPGYYRAGQHRPGRHRRMLSNRSRSSARLMSTCNRCSLATRDRVWGRISTSIQSCFALPALGSNGQYIEPYAHGPAFFNSDLTLEKGFGLGEGRNLRLRIAGFNFLNHPLQQFWNGLCIADHAPAERHSGERHAASGNLQSTVRLRLGTAEVGAAFDGSFREVYVLGGMGGGRSSVCRAYPIADWVRSLSYS